MSAAAAMPATVEYGITNYMPQEPGTVAQAAVQPQSVTYQQPGQVVYSSSPQVTYAAPQVTYASAAPTVQGADISAPQVTYAEPQQYTYTAQPQPVTYSAGTVQTTYASPASLSGYNQVSYTAGTQMAAPATSYTSAPVLGQTVYASPATYTAAPQVSYAAPTQSTHVTYAQATGPQPTYTIADSTSHAAPPTYTVADSISHAAPQVTYASASQPTYAAPQVIYTQATGPHQIDATSAYTTAAAAQPDPVVYQSGNQVVQQPVYQTIEHASQPVSYFQNMDPLPTIVQDHPPQQTVYQTLDQSQLAPQPQLSHVQPQYQYHSAHQYQPAQQVVQYASQQQSTSYAPTYHVVDGQPQTAGQPQFASYAPAYPGLDLAGAHHPFLSPQPNLAAPMEPSVMQGPYSQLQQPGHQLGYGQPPLFQNLGQPSTGNFPMTVNPELEQQPPMGHETEQNHARDHARDSAPKDSAPSASSKPANKQFKVSKKTKKGVCC